MTKIKFINHEQWGIDVKGFQPFIKRSCKNIDCMDGLLNVIFVNDVYIKALNKSYRGKDKSTDVLSFNYQLETKGSDDLLGEIYISIETAQKQAKEHHHSLMDELENLFVHGFLHIHGYDHEKDEDYKKMYDLECKILKKKLPFVETVDYEHS